MTNSLFRRMLRIAVAGIVGFTALHAMADSAASLQGKYTELREPLAKNSYGRAMYIDSSEAGDNLKGDVYAVLDHPFTKVSGALKDPADWCSILILPFNTKYCHAGQGSGGPALNVRIGRKFDQPVEAAYKIEFAMHNVAAQGDFFETRLNAGTGPFGTRDYRIVVSAVPIEGANKTFLHLSYSYGYGAMGRMAMRAYLATVGADKVGFSQQPGANGQPQYIGGVRGAIERNAMRYYLAIDSYLDSLSVPPEQRVEKRIQNWFNATERYPRQLREMDRPTYVAMKRTEVERQ
ncbi:MAG: hypothetical protein ABI907_14260, partial [Ramlibacter sp.]